MPRLLPLADGVAGRLYLSAMPGRGDGFAAARERLIAREIGLVVCLTPDDEIRRAAPDYARAIDRGALPWRHRAFPIANFGIADVPIDYLALVTDVADELRAGERVLIHCYAGIGRTGTLATAVLMALGLTESKARRRVIQAGSCPETPGQGTMVSWISARLKERTTKE